MSKASLSKIEPIADAPALPAKIGKYRVTARLGEGATSEVFLAHDDFQNRKAALTQMATGSTLDPTATTVPGAVPTVASMPAPRIGEPIGVMHIPAIDAEFTVVEGVDLANLARGPGHFLPAVYEGGSMVRSGHRLRELKGGLRGPA